MKRNLDKNKHQLTDWEKENLWMSIQDETSSSARKYNWFGLGWMRFTGGATVLAAMVLTVFIWSDNEMELVGSEVIVPGERAVQTQVAYPSESEVQKPAVMGRSIKLGTQEIIEFKKAGTDGEEGIMVVEHPESATSAEAKPEVADRKLKPGKKSHTISYDTFESFSIASLEKGISKETEEVMRSAQLYNRGGRSGEVTMQIDGEAIDNPLAGISPSPVPPPHPGSVTGGETPPNGEKFELMYFEHTGVNPFLPTEEDSLSTFAVDVDNASWNLTRNYLNRGSLPPKNAIRVEEFVNAFSTGLPEYRRPKGSNEAFTIHVDGGSSPFGKGYQLMRVSLIGETVDPENRKPASLIFVIDTSGSMRKENRLETVKDALNILLGELREGDTVGIVTYGSRGAIALEPTDISRRATIAAAINNLQCGGSTNAEEGLQLAYRMAREHYQTDVINRLILCSDGVANVGKTDADRVLGFVRTRADEGIALSAIGFGMGNYNDVFMEKLANKGDGNYYYVDTLQEAQRVFKENLTGTLQTIAREVKIQVAFDPETVERWRLIGYENRDVADSDFRNDKVDAGEIGAGHQVTALYEIKMKGSFMALRTKTLGTVRVRHEGPMHDPRRAGKVVESSLVFTPADVSLDLGLDDLHLQVQILAAEFAEILRGSYWAKENELQNLVPLADDLARQMGNDEQVDDLAKMIRKAASLAAEIPD